MNRPVFLLPVLLLLFGPILPARAVELRLVYTDQEVYPYLKGTGTEIPTRPGMSVELVRRCVERLGGQLTMSRIVSRRLVEELKAGHQDGALGLRFIDNRLGDLVFPLVDGQPDAERRAVRLAHSIYRRVGEPVQWDGRRITGLQGPVGATLITIDYLRLMGTEPIGVLSAGQLFNMLASRRVDAAVTLDVIGDREVQAAKDVKFEKLSPPVQVIDFYLPVSRRFYDANRPFVDNLWKLMGELREATYAELAPVYLF